MLGYLRRTWVTTYRRLLFRGPTSRTAESDEAWQSRQFRYYATQQPFASPLSVVHGNVTGETHEMRQAYREWAVKEPAAKAALLTKCFAVAQLDPQTHAADPDNPDDRRAAEWLKYSVQCSNGGWPNLIYNILFPGLIDGFSVLEKVFAKIDTRDNKYAGWWTLGDTASIDTQFLRFKLDTYRQVTGIQAVNGVQAAYVLPPKDFIIYTHLKLFENPFGFSDLRAAVRACRLIESAIRLRHILLTNYSGPFLKASSGDPAARSLLMEVLENARANGWIVVPDGSDVEVLSLSVANLETFRAAIEDYRQEIVQAIQGAYLQLLEGVVSNARGDTQVARGISELFVWWLAVTVCEVINKQLVPDLIVPNFGNTVGFPRVTLGGIDENIVTAALQRFKAGQELGLDLSKKQVMLTGGFEQPADEADTLKPPSAGPGQQGQDQNHLGSIFARTGKFADATDVFADESPDRHHVAAIFRSLPGTPVVCYNPQSDTFAEWHPYTNPKTGKSGWISSGGMVRYEDPRGGPVGPAEDERKRLSRADAQSAISDAIQRPERITEDHVPRLYGHMRTLTKPQLKEFVRSLGEKVGGVKAALADRIVARVKASQSGRPVQGQAIAAAPPPEHPVDAAARAENLHTLTPDDRKNLRADYDAQTTPEGRQASLDAARGTHRENVAHAARAAVAREVATHVQSARAEFVAHPAVTTGDDRTRREGLAIVQRGLDTARGADSLSAARYATRDAGRELDALFERSRQPTLARGQRAFTVIDLSQQPAGRRGWKVNLPSHPNADLYVYNVSRGRWHVANGRTGLPVARGSTRDAALRSLRLTADRSPESIDNPAQPNLPTSSAVPAPPPPPPVRAARTTTGPETYVQPNGPGAAREPVPPGGINARVGGGAAEAGSALFGRDVTTGDGAGLLAAASNAHTGGNVGLTTRGGGQLEVSTKGDGYTAVRTFGRDSRGNLFVHNDYFRVAFDRNPSPPPDWVQSNREVSGSKLLNNQIAALGKLGVKYIETYAARADSDNPNYGMNGYYTWPRLGYDSEIPDANWNRLPADLKQQVEANALGSPHARSVLNLMSTAKGRDWWKKNGKGLHDAKFDLTPGSLSMRVNEAYRKEQEAARAARARTPPAAA